jgi:hypothetical protein
MVTTKMPRSSVTFFARLKNVNLRTLDHLGAKAMYFIAVANEKMGQLP